LLIVKTTSTAFSHIQRAITELHSYDLPECICLEIETGSAAYLEWIGECVQSKSK
jgi:periplasmic divalent cation tolerance protein